MQFNTVIIGYRKQNESMDMQNNAPKLTRASMNRHRSVVD